MSSVTLSRILLKTKFTTERFCITLFFLYISSYAVNFSKGGKLKLAKELISIGVGLFFLFFSLVAAAGKRRPRAWRTARRTVRGWGKQAFQSATISDQAAKRVMGPPDVKRKCSCRCAGSGRRAPLSWSAKRPGSRDRPRRERWIAGGPGARRCARGSGPFWVCRMPCQSGTDLRDAG